MSVALRSVLKADLACNDDPFSRVTVTIFRIGQHIVSKPLLRVAWAIADLVWTRLLIGAELPPSVQCGPGLRLPHGGRGVILHPGTVIGADAWIYHRVTIGVRGDGRPPVLGDRVYIGCGASVLGPITVGDDAKVGAGAVVVHDVPARRTASGVPATTGPARPSD